MESKPKWPTKYCTESALEDNHDSFILGWLSGLMGALESPVVLWYKRKDPNEPHAAAEGDGLATVGRQNGDERDYQREACALCLAIRSYKGTTDLLCGCYDKAACMLAYKENNAGFDDFLGTPIDTTTWESISHESTSMPYYRYRCPLTNLEEWAVPIYVRKQLAGVFITGQFLHEGEKLAKIEDILATVEPTLKGLKNEERAKIVIEIQTAHAKLQEHLKVPDLIRVITFLQKVQTIQADLERFFDARVHMFEIETVNEANRTLTDSVSHVHDLIDKNGFRRLEMATQYFKVINDALKGCVQAVSGSAMPIECYAMFYPTHYRDAIAKTPEQSCIVFVVTDHESYQLNTKKLVELYELKPIDENGLCVLAREALLNPPDSLTDSDKIHCFSMDRKTFVAYWMRPMSKPSDQGELRSEVECDKSIRFIFNWLSSTYLALWHTGFSGYEECYAKQASNFLGHETKPFLATLSGRAYYVSQVIDTALAYIDREKRRNVNEAMRRYERDIKGLEEPARLFQSESGRLSVVISNYTILFVDDAKRDMETIQPFIPLEDAIFYYQEQGVRKQKPISLSVSDAEKKALRQIRMHGVRLLLRQAFENLLANALKYSHENTKIIVTAEVVPEGTIEKPDREVLRIMVSNFGEPIEFASAQDRGKKLFALGFRGENARLTNAEGIGYGLAIAHKVLKLHGGAIWLERNESLSNFNIPQLLHTQISRIADPLTKEEQERMDAYEEEYRRCWQITQRITHGTVDAVNVQNFKLLNRRMKQPTAEIAFAVELPIYKTQPEGVQA